jgi:hypothetical protein
MHYCAYIVASMLRHERVPPDQVVRREVYEAAHPDTRIAWRVSYWEAVIPEENGETVIVRNDLKALLDKLEVL